jgi:uncharacterized protein with NAD-binding domain and iron-sulfur cluster
VAILGGGCGGLAAAWTLSATPELRRRFAITVYQQGWQLGGKGASGRMPHGAGTAVSGQRIEEHGLHIWFGFYAHAFRMLRQAYEESGLARGDDWWRIPFEKCDGVTLYEQRADDDWLRHAVDFSSRGGRNGGPPVEPRRLPLGRVIARTTRVLANSLRADLGSARRSRGPHSPPGTSSVEQATSALDEIAQELDRIPSGLLLDSDADTDTTHVTRGARQTMEHLRASELRAGLDNTLSRLQRQVAGLLGELETSELSGRARLWGGVLELAAASLAGIVSDDVVRRGFAVLDEEDLRDWLGRHGARPETLERSPVLQGLYDLTFAYREGDKRRPSLAAGRGLQSLVMMMNYEGAFMWRMRAGMGDVVFAPLYLALKQRGVSFQFFSRITHLGVATDRAHVDSIEIEREAALRSGPGGYDPLKQLGDWWCWPATADESQISDRPARREVLMHERDFDEVVLAIPVGAQSDICAELAAANPRFRRMLDGASTVRTKALQVWLQRPIDELRKRTDGGALDAPATGYSEPFDTYCDMSHLLPAEGYDGDRGPRGLAYFCSVMPDSVSPADADRFVRTAAADYLERHTKQLWPGAFKDNEFDWNVVFDPLGRQGRERLEAQYVRTNVGGSDRYVTTPAGSVDSRLRSDESGFENVVLAGDWTHSGIDGGCVEAAVMSGEQAGTALIARGPRQMAVRTAPRYVEYGALATAPGPLLCERARLYCFFLATDRDRVQSLCDRVLKHPTGGALRYRVPSLAPVVLTFGVIAGLRSLHPAHSGRASASEPEAAIWIPTIGQRYDAGRYVDDHLAVFMPYIWVDDPVAFASGREVYGFAKTQGWIRDVGDPRGRGRADASERSGPPDPPAELALDVHGAADFSRDAVLGRNRLITVRRASRTRDGGKQGQGMPGPDASEGSAAGDDLASLLRSCLSSLDPGGPERIPYPTQRSAIDRRRIAAARSHLAVLAELAAEQALRHVFLKQVRDAGDGERAALQQVVEARSRVTPGSLRWRRLRDTYEISISQLASHPLQDELGLAPEQKISLAFAAEFGFRMETGVVRWP